MSGKAIRGDRHAQLGTVLATRPHCKYGTRDIIIIYTHIIGTTCSVAANNRQWLWWLTTQCTLTPKHLSGIKGLWGIPHSCQIIFGHLVLVDLMFGSWKIGSLIYYSLNSIHLTRISISRKYIICKDQEWNHSPHTLHCFVVLQIATGQLTSGP